MIGYLTGTVHDFTAKAILVLTASGVGYSVFPAGSLLARVGKGKEIACDVLMVVRENEISLYGFGDNDEKVLFQKLIGVSGIGPKMGLEMVSVPPKHFLQAVEEGDIAFLTKIPGLGKKKAERLVVELRGKIDLTSDGDGGTPVTPVKEEATEALESLGYDRASIQKVLHDAPAEMSAEQLVRYFLGSKT